VSALYSDYILSELCEMASLMAPVLAPAVRAQFAKRLRSLRAQRGYERARHFAKSLGIEENRYTRYERAEVEPSLTLIYEICQKLAVTPNELLGFADGAARAKPAVAEPAVGGSAASEATVGSRTADLRVLAWQLASEAARLQAQARGADNSSSDPLRLVRDTGRLYSRLEQDPFGTVADIVNDPALQDVTGERKVKLAALIAAYTAGMSE
jgi:transcriptional regulator with XRE-family HTH domain